MRVLSAFFCFALCGCVGDLDEKLHSGSDGGGGDGSGVTDMGCPGDAATVRFSPDVAMILDSRCATAGCHAPGGSGAGTYPLVPNATGADLMTNYMKTMAEAMKGGTGAGSTLMQKAIGMQSHGGGAILQTTDNAYMKLISWINQCFAQ